MYNIEKNNYFDGLIAATYAPMNPNLSLNLDQIPSYADFLVRNNVSGVFLNGSTGDFASLTVQERKKLLDTWYKYSKQGLRLMNHVGHTSLKVAKDLAAHSEGKVDAISALAPFYFRLPSLESLVDYCRSIAEEAPSTPFYYYHIPDLSGADFEMAEFMPIAKEQIPTFAGIKFTKNNLIDFRNCINFDTGSKNILFGVDEIFLSGLSFGAAGWVGSTYNHLAPLYLKIKSAFENNNHELAAELQTKSMTFVDVLNSRGGFNGAGKSFMKILGIDCGPSRFPHKTFLDKELNDIKAILKNCEIMDYTSQ